MRVSTLIRASHCKWRYAKIITSEDRAASERWQRLLLGALGAGGIDGEATP
jgi:hypothetical protein